MKKSSTSKSQSKTEIKWDETQIGERMKELKLFFNLSRILDRENITLDELYQELVNIIPKSWKYAEVACARIMIDDNEFCTENFTGSKWMQSAPVKVNKTVVGRIEIGYLEERPEQDEGPFLKEERHLMEATAERLGHIIERKLAEQELIIANKELAFQNKEKEKRADELIIANKELAFQNEEKEKRADELIIANERTREMNEYLENLLNYANALIIVWNAQYKITRFNKAFESITGRTEKDVIGESVEILFPTVNKESSMELIKNTIDGEQWSVVEIDILNLDGSVRTLQWNSANILSQDEKTIIATIAQGHDITMHKLAEHELRESESRYRTLVENLPQKIFMKSSEYKWISVNKNLALDFGINPEKIIGKLDHDLFSKELADKYHADDVRIITTGKTEELEEKYVVDGKETWVNTIKTPVRDDNGEIVGLLGIFWDITGRKQDEQEIKKLNNELEDRVNLRTAQLEATNKELEAFSYSVSHDLRAPLRHVSGYVELLNKHFLSDLPEKGQHYLNSVADSVRLMGVLIDDLLQFSRSSRLEMHLSDFDMNEIVKKTIESLCKDNPDRKIDWVRGKLPSVYGDEAMFRLVWINLLSNAVKFTRTRRKARIEVGVREENKERVFFVRDNGVGFDMQYAQKLFGVFQRLHSTEEFEGTGIGLANVHRIVLRHGGRTWAEAEPDKGAEFNFSIPNKL